MAASNEHIGSSMTYEWNKCAIIKLKEGFTNEYSNMKLDKDTMQKELIRMKTQLLFFSKKKSTTISFLGKDLSRFVLSRFLIASFSPRIYFLQDIFGLFENNNVLRIVMLFQILCHLNINMLFKIVSV
jgi:hypothetical protein